MVNVLYPWKYPKAKVLKIEEAGMNHKIKSLSSFTFTFFMERLAKDRVSHKLVTERDKHLSRIHKVHMEYLLFSLLLSDFVNHRHSLCLVTAQHCWFRQEQNKRRLTKCTDFKPWMLSNKYFPSRTGRQYANQLKYAKLQSVITVSGYWRPSL